ncbi:MAG: glycosyltransferase [Sedimentisphaerales bacterium]|nr:glycosyltransferase [Sedimentisphaerales bacterium]
MSRRRETDTSGEIICFAGCDWWYHNRGLFCPQVMRRLAKDYKVLFVNSLGMRVPSLRKDRNAARKIIRKLRSMLRFLRKSDNGMWVLSPISLPLASGIGRKLNALGVYLQVKLAAVLMRFREPVIYIGCPPALDVVRKLGPARFVIYERTDLFEEMPGADRSYIASLDEELTKSSDLVLYVNRTLYEQGREANKNSLLLGHGVDFDFFVRSAESEESPEDICGIARPIVGFFGDVSDKTSDLNLIEFAAKKLPDTSFVFVGPVSADIVRLRDLSNVHFLGPKPYEQVPLYGKEFDVAMMPWNQNKWIEFCNPVKAKEYLALGRPVVSMYYPEVEPYSDIIYVARDYEGFVSCIREAIAENDPAKVRQRRARVKDETWDAKVEQIRAAIEKGARREECKEGSPAVRQSAARPQ